MTKKEVQFDFGGGGLVYLDCHVEIDRYSIPNVYSNRSTVNSRQFQVQLWKFEYNSKSPRKSSKKRMTMPL